MSAPVRITLLGGFAVHVGGDLVDPVEWRRRQAAAVVKLLALTPSHALHREQLIDALWPEVDLENAAPRLHKAAHYARKALGPESVVLGGDKVSLFPGTRVAVDALEFERAATSALRAGDPTAAGKAADSYPGDLLPDDIYEPWADDARDRLRVMHQDVLRLAGRWRDLTSADPTDEEAHRMLAEQLAAAGDVRGALRELERLEQTLSHELGVTPGPDVLDLRQRLLQGSAEATSPDSGLADLAPVGRDDEVREIDRVMTVARRGEGQALFICGRDGMGTTTLLRVVAGHAARAGMRVGVGVAARVAGEWSYAPVLEALSDLCRRDASLLAQLAPELRDQIGGALAGQRTSWDGESAHQRLFVAAAELVRRAADGSGVALVLDQLDAADEASHRLLHYLARSCVALPVLIAVGHRPTSGGTLAQLRDSLRNRGQSSTIDVAPLTRDAALRLARGHLADADEGMLEAIYLKSGGAPFAVVELARAAGGDPDLLDASQYLTAGVSAPTRSALARVAVLGADFDTDEVSEMTGLPDDEVFEILDDGLAHRVLRRTRTGFAFRHPLIHESLLTLLGPRQRQSAHLDAAGALERLRRSPAQVGHHLVQAGRAEEAVPWMLEAAETEAARGAYRDALRTLEQVEGAADGERRARLLQLRADLMLACGDIGVVDAYRAALAAAAPSNRTRLLTRLARAATLTGDLETASLAISEVDLDGSDNDPDVLLARGNLAFLQSDWVAADEAATAARSRIALGGGERWQLFELVALQGLIAHRRGEWFQRLRTELRVGMAQPEVAAGIFDSHLCVAEYLLYGPTPYDEVLDLAQQLRQSAQEAGVLRAVAFATALRGEAALLKGDLAVAEQELLDSADLHHELSSAAGEAHSLQRLAEVHLARGDRDTANALLLRALPMARWSPIGLHLLQRIYGTMIAAAPDAATARAVVDRAEATLAHEDACHFCTIMLDLPAARACIDAGDLERARHHLASAETSAQLWEGTSWQASLLVARAHLERAEGRADAARTMLVEAAGLFDVAGQPLDAARCRSELAEVA